MIDLGQCRHLNIVLQSYSFEYNIDINELTTPRYFQESPIGLADSPAMSFVFGGKLETLQNFGKLVWKAGVVAIFFCQSIFKPGR